MKFKCGIFDLDGVITQTRDLHFNSWKQLFDEFLKVCGDSKEFQEKDYTDYVDGRPRYEGVETFLKSRNIELKHGDPKDKPWKPEDKKETTVCALGNTKDGYFNDALQKDGAKIYDSTVEIIKQLKADGVKIGVASSSKNCRPVLERSNLTDLFDAILDGVDLEEDHIKGKPAPDMFLDCLKLTCENSGIGKVEPKDAILVEDAQSGVQAGSRGHFGLVLGIDRGGNRAALKKGGAHFVVNDFSELDLPKLDKWFEAPKTNSQGSKVA
eukprot:Phypoly_transcript_03924.p1 GENE.Phypoly_transcript_03924~~Phypoly_transcript_03924.p1  ORF type:complete len:268 (+),score=43.21 Phypoly_transcript_03924:1464-2267(+)